MACSLKALAWPVQSISLLKLGYWLLGPLALVAVSFLEINIVTTTAEAAVSCTPDSVAVTPNARVFGRPEAVVCDSNQVLPASGFIGQVQPSGSVFTCGNTGLATGPPCVVAGSLDPAGARSGIQQSCSNPTNGITITESTNPGGDFGGLHLSGDGSCDYRATWTSNGVAFFISGTATRAGVNIIITNLSANNGVFDGAADLDSAAANLTPIIMNNTARNMTTGVSSTVSQRLNNAPTIFDVNENGFFYSLGNGQIEADTTSAFGSLDQVSDPIGRSFGLNIWVKADGDFLSSDNNSADGSMYDIIGGIDQRTGPNSLMGVMFGFGGASFDTQGVGGSGTFESDSVHVGLYSGAKYGDINIDGFIAYSRSQYEDRSGIIVGNFNADRLTMGANLSGTFHQGMFLISPTASFTYAIETQEGYVDSGGTAHASRDISAGRLSLGPKISVPYEAENGTHTPWVAIQAEWDLTNQQQTLTTILPGMDNMVSGRFSAGIHSRFENSVEITISGDFSGLGSGEYSTYGGNVSFNVPLN